VFAPPKLDLQDEPADGVFEVAVVSVVERFLGIVEEEFT
jgi:hypothetical protein